jgi:hypothetical protein
MAGDKMARESQNFTEDTPKHRAPSGQEPEQEPTLPWTKGSTAGRDTAVA